MTRRVPGPRSGGAANSAGFGAQIVQHCFHTSVLSRRPGTGCWHLQSNTHTRSNMAPAECPVCCNTYTGHQRRRVECGYCANECCSACLQQYLLTLPSDAQCMGCKRAIDGEFLSIHLPKTWLLTEYKAHREKVLLDREMALLPDSQDLLQNYRDSQRLQGRVAAWEGEGSAGPRTGPRWRQGRWAEGAGMVGRMMRGGGGVGAVVTDRPQWPQAAVMGREVATTAPHPWQVMMGQVMTGQVMR